MCLFCIKKRVGSSKFYQQHKDLSYRSTLTVSSVILQGDELIIYLVLFYRTMFVLTQIIITN